MEEQLSRRERKKIQARNTILEAGAKLFDSCGFQSTSIADIMNGLIWVLAPSIIIFPLRRMS